jgi:hypothetical protein
VLTGEQQVSAEQQNGEYEPAWDLVYRVQRFSCVLGMFSRLEVKVLSQPDGGEG